MGLIIGPGGEMILVLDLNNLMLGFAPLLPPPTKPTSKKAPLEMTPINLPPKHTKSFPSSNPELTSSFPRLAVALNCRNFTISSSLLRGIPGEISFSCPKVMSVVIIVLMNILTFSAEGGRVRRGCYEEVLGGGIRRC